MKKLLLFIPIVLYIIGCGGAAVNYFPLSVGSVWEYWMTSTTTTPTDTTETTGTQYVEITEETTLDDGTEVVEQMTITTTVVEPDTSVDTTYTYMEETEDYIRGYEDKADTLPDTWAELPIEEGNTWDVNDIMSAVVLGKEAVSVPAGNYDDCWEIGYITDNDTVYVYFADGVGMVRQYMEITEGDVVFESETELESATIE
jgi:CBS domain-containing protein